MTRQRQHTEEYAQVRKPRAKAEKGVEKKTGAQAVFWTEANMTASHQTFSGQQSAQALPRISLAGVSTQYTPGPGPPPSALNKENVSEAKQDDVTSEHTPTVDPESDELFDEEMQDFLADGEGIGGEGNEYSEITRDEAAEEFGMGGYDPNFGQNTGRVFLRWFLVIMLVISAFGVGMFYHSYTNPPLTAKEKNDLKTKAVMSLLLKKGHTKEYARYVTELVESGNPSLWRKIIFQNMGVPRKVEDSIAGALSEKDLFMRFQKMLKAKGYSFQDKTMFSAFVSIAPYSKQASVTRQYYLGLWVSDTYRGSSLKKLQDAGRFSTTRPATLTEVLSFLLNNQSWFFQYWDTTKYPQIAIPYKKDGKVEYYEIRSLGISLKKVTFSTKTSIPQDAAIIPVLGEYALPSSNPSSPSASRKAREALTHAKSP